MRSTFNNIFHVTNIKNFYEGYEGRIGAATIFIGFIFDNLTLRDASITAQTIVFVTYLILSMLAIIILNYLESREGGKASYPRFHFWAFILLQFAIGSLFSMFFVFYSRGFSISYTWPLLLLLFANMVGSELYKKKYSRLSVQISLLFISIFSFSIYFLPVAVHRISGWIFIGSGILSFILLYLFLRLLSLIAPRRVSEDKKGIVIGVGIVYLLINVFYLLNVIPPVPLVMKDGGVYHNISWQADHYLVVGEKRGLKDYFTLYPKFHYVSGEPVYIVAAIYAPAALNTTIVHDWQFYDEASSEWRSVTEVPVAIVGGREAGYRSYSMKENIVPGLWRVDITTAGGKIIGRIKFEIIENTVLPTLEEDIF